MLQVTVTVPAEARVVAALHDVLEDSDLTPEDLRGQGLSEVELEAVLLLTHPEEEPYADYIERIARAEAEAGRLARIVKLADLHNNLSRLTPEFEHLRERYEKALAGSSPSCPTLKSPVSRSEEAVRTDDSRTSRHGGRRGGPGHSPQRDRGRRDRLRGRVRGHGRIRAAVGLRPRHGHGRHGGRVGPDRSGQRRCLTR